MTIDVRAIPRPARHRLIAPFAADHIIGVCAGTTIATVVDDISSALLELVEVTVAQFATASLARTQGGEGRTETF